MCCKTPLRNCKRPLCTKNARCVIANACYVPQTPVTQLQTHVITYVLKTTAKQLQTGVFKVACCCYSPETECIKLENQMIDLFGHWEDRRFTAIRKKVGTRKFHRLFHMVNAIRQFGNSDVTCSGRWEHFHKFVAKLQYKRTSRRKKNFSREMHEVHLFLRHLDALTDYQEGKGCAWFVQHGKTASSAAEDTGSSRLNSPLDPALGFRMQTE